MSFARYSKVLEVLSENGEPRTVPAWVTILNKYTNRTNSLMVAGLKTAPPPPPPHHHALLVKRKNSERLHQAWDYRKLSEVK